MTIPARRRPPGIGALPIVETRREQKNVLGLLRLVPKTRWWLVSGAFIASIGVTAVFAAVDDDRLRMSDDFAAMISAALALLLTLSFLEMDRSVRRAQRLADAQLAAAQSGIPVPGTETVLSPATRSGAALGITALLMWLCGSLLMGSALVLVFLWAAIDGHGPAGWLAWYALLSTSAGLGGLLAATAAKAMSDLDALKDMYMRSISTYLIRSSRPGGGRAEGEEINE